MLYRLKFGTFIRIYDGPEGRDVSYITQRQTVPCQAFSSQASCFLLFVCCLEISCRLCFHI
jgi:hypothetical protein